MRVEADDRSLLIVSDDVVDQSEASDDDEGVDEDVTAEFTDGVTTTEQMITTVPLVEASHRTESCDSATPNELGPYPTLASSNMGLGLSVDGGPPAVVGFKSRDHRVAAKKLRRMDRGRSSGIDTLTKQWEQQLNSNGVPRAGRSASSTH